MNTHKLIGWGWSLIVAITAVPAHAELVADYLFAGNLDDALNSAPALIERVPGDGSFVPVRLDGRITTGYRFSAGAGLEFSTSGLLDNDEYTIAVLMSFDMISGYRKLVDFKALENDSGLYVHSGVLQFYPVYSSQSLSVLADTFYQFVVSRSADGTVTGYIDGVESFEFDDTTSNHGLISGDDLITFFRDDNTTSNNENSAGMVLRIRIFDTALNAEAVAALEIDRRGVFVFGDRFENEP